MSSSSARRIAVEITVIVGSILLAFALDAAWDERQEKDRVDELLAAVADDFDREAIVLDSIIAINRWRETVQTAFLSATDPDGPMVSADSLALLATLSGDQQIYDPSFGALDAMLSSGGIERVRDPELRRLLAGWPAELRDLEWEQNQAYDAVDGVLGSLADLGLMTRVNLLRDFWPARVEAGQVSPSHRQREAVLDLTYRLYTDDLERIRRRAGEVEERIRTHLGGAR